MPRRGPVRTIRRTLVATAALALLAVTTALPAAAAADRVLVEPGGDPVDPAALVRIVERAERDGLRLSIHVLADEPAGGAEAEADRIVTAVGGAALVVTPQAVGAVSDDPTHATAAAADAALDELAVDDDVVAAAEVFAATILGTGPAATTASEGQVELPGLGAVSITVLIVGAIILLVLVSIVRRAGRRRMRRAGMGRAPGMGPPVGRRRRRRGVGGAIPGAAVGYGLGRRRARTRSNPPFGGGGSPPFGGGGSPGRSTGGGARSSGGGSRAARPAPKRRPSSGGGRSRGGGGRSSGGGRRR